MSPKRTRLKPVYLTDCERDLVVQTLQMMRLQLDPNPVFLDRGVPSKFARSFTAQRLQATAELFKDKQP